MNLQHDLYSMKEMCFATSIIHVFKNEYFIVSKFTIFYSLPVQIYSCDPNFFAVFTFILEKYSKLLQYYLNC